MRSHSSFTSPQNLFVSLLQQTDRPLQFTSEILRGPLAREVLMQAHSFEMLLRTNTVLDPSDLRWRLPPRLGSYSQIEHPTRAEIAVRLFDHLQRAATPERFNLEVTRNHLFRNVTNFTGANATALGMLFVCVAASFGEEAVLWAVAAAGGVSDILHSSLQIDHAGWFFYGAIQAAHMLKHGPQNIVDLCDFFESVVVGAEHTSIVGWLQSLRPSRGASASPEMFGHLEAMPTRDSALARAWSAALKPIVFGDEDMPTLQQVLAFTGKRLRTPALRQAALVLAGTWRALNEEEKIVELTLNPVLRDRIERRFLNLQVI